MPFSNAFNSDFYKEKPVLTANELVAWKRKNNFYNFDTLPKTAIISAVTSFSFPKRITSKKLKGLNGNNYVLNKQHLYCYGFGVGAPAVIVLLEELVVLGVTNFLYIGFAGRLNTVINEAEPFMVSGAFSLNGTSFFYEKESFVSYPNNFSNQLKRDLQLSEKIVLSIDAPFRETKNILDFYTEKETTLIDMETASILAFFKQNQLEVACVLIASDLITSTWMPPQNIKLLQRKAQKIIDHFIRKK